MDYDWENPETRKAIDTSDMVKSYFTTSNPKGSPKPKMALEKWLPWIAIGLVLLVAWYFNQKMVGFGANIDAVVRELNKIPK